MIVEYLLILLSISNPTVNSVKHGYSHIDYQPLMIRRRLIWTKQIDFNDPSNWEPHFPCHKDRVILPENHAIFIDRPLIISELILPENGELIISKNGGIVEFVSDSTYDNDPYCPSKNPDQMETIRLKVSAEYERTNSWFNPDNWHVSFNFDKTNPTSSAASYQISTFATFHYQQSGKQTRMIIPDSERIPCRHDFVDFATNGTWKVNIGKHSQLIPSIASLTIGSKFSSFRTESLRQFLGSFIGQMLFSIDGYNHMEIETSLECRGSVQCLCGNDKPKVMEQICQFRSCPPVRCHDPIKARGFCCPICGTNIIIKLKKRANSNLTSDNTEWFVYGSLSRHLNKLYQRKEWQTPNIALYVHWLYDHSIQIVITPIIDENNDDSNNPLMDSHRNGRKIFDKLSNDETLAKLILISYQSSRDWIRDSLLYDTLIVIIIIFILLLTFFGLLIVYHRIRMIRNNQIAFTFVRFRTAASDIEMEFDNPGLADDNSIAQSSNMPTSSSIKDGLSDFPNKIKRIIADLVPQQRQPPAIRLRSHNEHHHHQQQPNEFENPMFHIN